MVHSPFTGLPFRPATTTTSNSAPVPFVGRMSYCLTKSLKMALDYRGDMYPLPFLERVSTEPGACRPRFRVFPG
jgi:hypothetical protein